jgi:hypothetical protein
VTGTPFEFIADKGMLLKQRPYCKETEEGIMVHYFPGIASAAIEQVVNQTWNDKELASIVPVKIVELIKSGEIEWVRDVRLMINDTKTRSKNGRHQDQMIRI